MDLVVTSGRDTGLYRMGMTNRTTTLSRVDMNTTSRINVVNEMEVQVCAHTEARICEVDIKARGSTANRTQNYNAAHVSTSSTHQGMYSVQEVHIVTTEIFTHTRTKNLIRRMQK
jgi:hypothetical protein